MENKKKLTCPECQNTIDTYEDMHVGDVIECPHCGSELRITAIDPNETIQVSVIEEEK